MANTVGYDVFISYRQGDSKAYALSLHAALEDRKLVVFLDTSDEGAGGAIERFSKFASWARSLVVIVTPGIFVQRVIEVPQAAHAPLPNPHDAAA